MCLLATFILSEWSWVIRDHACKARNTCYLGLYKKFADVCPKVKLSVDDFPGLGNQAWRLNTDPGHSRGRFRGLYTRLTFQWISGTSSLFLPYTQQLYLFCPASGLWHLSGKCLDDKIILRPPTVWLQVQCNLPEFITFYIYFVISAPLV